MLRFSLSLAAMMGAILATAPACIVINTSGWDEGWGDDGDWDCVENCWQDSDSDGLSDDDEDRCGTELNQTGSSVDLIAPGSIEEQTLDGLLAQIGWTRS